MIAPFYLFLGMFSLHVNIATNADIRPHVFVNPKTCEGIFDTFQFRCEECVNKTQEISDGRACSCPPKFKKQNISKNTFVCQSCEEKTMIPCVCPSSISVEVSKEVVNTSNNEYCKNCPLGTHLSADGTRCVPCPLDPLNSTVSLCLPCPEGYENLNNECIPKRNIAVDSEYHYKGGTVKSSFIEKYFKLSLYKCEFLHVQKACHLLANMCVLHHYDKKINNGSCQLYNSLSDSVKAPAIYFRGSVLSNKSNPTKFSFKSGKKDSVLNFYFMKFSSEGMFIGYEELTFGTLQICKSTDVQASHPFSFGVWFNKECTVTLQSLLKDWKTDFYEIYLKYEENGKEMMHPIPILNLNLNKNIKRDNPKEWQLTRRLFIVDNILGVSTKSDPSNPQPEVVRYAKSVIISIEACSDTEDLGKIFPPLITVEYGEISLSRTNPNKHLEATFKVIYTMNLNKAEEDVSIAIGVLSAFAILWSIIRTWIWMKRSGQIVVDIMTLLKLILYCSNCLANIFFVVLFFATFFRLCFYKGQEHIVMMLPTEEQEYNFRIYIIVAFILKTVAVLHIFVVQVNIDIFLIDWERPLVSSSSTSSTTAISPSVSIWRTLFIANEWNSLQMIRKTQKEVQFVVLLVFLKVLGFENLARATPEVQFYLSPSDVISPFSQSCRFIVASCVFLGVAFCQWVIGKFYERFVRDKIWQFTDVSSLSNISVFMLIYRHYGFYIHGRSVHGVADTDMKNFSNNLKKEEENLCGQRGLIPNTELQTFQIFLTKEVVEQLEKIMAPVKKIHESSSRIQFAIPAASGNNLEQMSSLDCTINTYQTMNRFLATFIDHAIRDMDYTVKDKQFVESLLDVEFQDPTDKSYFFNDPSHSFDKMLLYGQETLLLLWEVLFLSVADLCVQDFVFATVITYSVTKAIELLRKYFSRRNLVQKTLIDNRFLL